MERTRSAPSTFVIRTGPDYLGMIASDQQLIGRNGWLLTRTISGLSNKEVRYFPAFDLKRFDQAKTGFSRSAIGLAKRRLQFYQELERAGFEKTLGGLRKNCLISHKQPRVWQESEKLVDLYFKGIRIERPPPYSDENLSHP